MFKNPHLHKYLALAVLASFLMIPAAVKAQEETGDTKPEKTVLRLGFVAVNSSGRPELSNITGFEQKLTAILSASGFNVVQPRIVLDSINNLEVSGRKYDGAKDAKKFMNDRLAVSKLMKMLGLNCFLFVSIDGFNMSTLTNNAYIKTVIQERTLSVSYKFINAGDGTVLFGGSVKATDKKPKDQYSGASESDYLQVLYDRAADNLVKDLNEKKEQALKALENVKEVTAKNVEIDVKVTVEGLSIPQIVKEEKGYRLVPGKRSVGLDGADVAWNGVTVGSVSGKVTVPEGLGLMTVTKTGYEKWERMVNASKGVSINLAVKMTPDHEKKLKDSIEFFVKLDENRMDAETARDVTKLVAGEAQKDAELAREVTRKLTDAEVAVMQGHAKMLEQSGFRIDFKSTETIDIKENIKIEED